MNFFAKIDNQLKELQDLYHVPNDVRDQISSCAALARSISEKFSNQLKAFTQVYEEVLDRLLLYFHFSLEHKRQDTKKCLEEIGKTLAEVLVPEGEMDSYIEKAKKAFLKMDKITNDFFQIMLVRYRLDLEKLRRKLKQIKKNLGDGLSEPIRAIWEGFPKSAIVKDYQEQIKKFEKFLLVAERCFESKFKGKYSHQWEEFRRAGRAYESAKYYSIRTQEPRKLIPIDKEFSSLLQDKNAVERLNRAYYSLRGQDIYKDFFTKASADQFLSYGDAEHFFAFVHQLMQRGEKLPKTLNVIECGIGDGRFAGDFLDRLALLDLEYAAQYEGVGEPELIYPQVLYHLYDFSEKMIAEAKESNLLRKHQKNVVFHVLDVIHETPNPEGGIFYARFQELFDDLPRAPLIYVSPQGKFFELRVALAAERDIIVRDHEFGQGDEKEFYHLLKSQKEEDFSHYHPETLEKVVVRCKLFPIQIEKFPFGKDIQEMIGEFRDILLPVSIGATDYVERISKNLNPRLGYMHIFDYGYAYPSPFLHRPYYYVSQANRRFGGSLTNDVSFPLFGLWARRNGFRTHIFLQEKLVGKVTEKPMVDTTPFVPGYSGRSLIRHVSVPEGMFQLPYLRFFSDIEEDFQSFSNGARSKRSEKKFNQWVNQLREKGLLGPGPKFLFSSAAENDLENLSFELDFWVNGIYRCLVENENLHWLPLKTEFIRKALDELGFDSRKVFKNIHRNPYYGAFWVLRVGYS